MRPTPADPTPHRGRGLLPALLASVLLVLPGAVLAWGKPAHRVVANLAEARLRPAARAEAARLLATGGATHLAEVSGWADDVRRAGGQASRDTRRWHFVNFDTGCEYAPARDCPDGDCIVAAINRQILRLADRRLPDAERAEALKFLVHMVADVHQPLHTTPRALRGGLGVQLQWRGEGSNLHMAWDVWMFKRALESTGLGETAYVRGLLHAPPLPGNPRSERRAADWAQASCRVIEADALLPGTHKPGDAYLDAHRARMDRQLGLAGMRLADVLNFALDPPKAAAQR
jgi:hypothetical protein